MDKEHLISYFREHYFTRKEVQMRLPLNITIDSFWPELVDHRRAGAILLPLYSADGLPYWYNLTARMIRASEIISEAVLEQNEDYDPHCQEMTQAMTEEMYFTSLVEGAQIPIEDGISFLQSSTEPGNVFEQLLANNRLAWATMAQGLCHPMDDVFIKTLAAMLTQDMEGYSADYRTSDEHEVFAMIGESFRLPSASLIPRYMCDFYSFLMNGSVHPLIKAAVGQAYILAIRPFDDGNERLARMISYLVLLRSGYGFYADVSISCVIAAENYKYFRNLREILRPDNGNDLTYFIEYYLEILVRALERYRRDRESEQNHMLELERGMARQPIIPAFRKPDYAEQVREIRAAMAQRTADAENTVIAENAVIAGNEEKPTEAKEKPDADAQNAITETGAENEEQRSLQENTAIAILQSAQTIPMFDDTQDDMEEDDPPERKTGMDMASLNLQLRQFELSENPRFRQLAGLIRDAVKEGFTEFSSSDWGRHYDLTGAEADRFCRAMYKYSIADRQKTQKGFIYRINVSIGEAADQKNGEAEAAESLENADTLSAEPPSGPDTEGPPELMRKLEELEMSTDPEDIILTQRVRYLLSGGITHPSLNLWAGLFNMTKQKAGEQLEYMRSIELVERRQRGKIFTYYFVGYLKKSRQKEILTEEQFWNNVERLERSSSERNIAMGKWIRSMVRAGQYEFEAGEIGRVTGTKGSEAGHCRDRLSDLRLIRNVSEDASKLIYRLNVADIDPGNHDDMRAVPMEMREILKAMCEPTSTPRDQRIGEFLISRLNAGEIDFTAEDWIKHCHVTMGVSGDDIRKAVNLGLIRRYSHHDSTNTLVYRINSTVPSEVRCNDLTELQKKYISLLYSNYGLNGFTISDFSRIVKTKPSTMSYHIANLVQREIITSHSNGQNVYSYRLRVSPDSHPDCFVEDVSDAGENDHQPAAELTPVAG